MPGRLRSKTVRYRHSNDGAAAQVLLDESPLGGAARVAATAICSYVMTWVSTAVCLGRKEGVGMTDHMPDDVSAAGRDLRAYTDELRPRHGVVRGEPLDVRQVFQFFALCCIRQTPPPGKCVFFPTLLKQKATPICPWLEL